MPHIFRLGIALGSFIINASLLSKFTICKTLILWGRGGVGGFGIWQFSWEFEQVCLKKFHFARPRAEDLTWSSQLVGALDPHVFQYFLNLPQNYSLRSSSTSAIFFIYLKNQFRSHRISTISFYYNLYILGVLYWNNSPPHNGPLEYRSVVRKVAFKQSYLLFKGRILIKVAEYVTKERPSLRSWHVVERAHAIRKFSTSRVQQTAVPLICGMGILGIRKSKVLTVFLSRMVIERRRMRTADWG